jgi:hypothetical protein
LTTLARSPAVALFVDRARAVSQDFAPTIEQLHTVAWICQVLAGIPLGIELAAARTEVALLHVHVVNALNFVDVLEKEVPFTEAVELYLDALEVRDSVAEVAYYLALAKLAEDRLPKRSRGRLTPGGGERDLRLVDQGGS